MSCELLQLFAAQDVPWGTAHEPAPLQSACRHAAAFAVHSFFGSVPAAAFSHEVPDALTTEQVPQLRPAVVQRIPETVLWQEPEAHIPARVQTSPTVTLGTQVPLQYSVLAHSASDAQVPAQLVASAQASPFGHAALVAAQLPAASHAYRVSCELLQLSAPQEVPWPTAQEPAPLHSACLQVEASASHSFFGSVPDDAFTQPLPLGSTSWQSPQLLLAQMRPDAACSQRPVSHSAAWVQLAPSASFGTQ